MLKHSLILLLLLWNVTCTPLAHWNLVKEYGVDDKLPIFKYVSNKTGLTLVIAHVSSPIVNGKFCLATETFNNDGLPHTLEHLIFQGSEDYPYKRILSLLSNRCLAGYVNAATYVDSTCYTVYTAGTEGFLTILPIYMDHIFYPLLLKESFITEIHHINGKGQDAGVVYSEMQGKANSVPYILRFALLRELYSSNASISQETGGSLSNLRERTNIRSIKDYHKLYYRPENLRITISGNIGVEEILKALVPIENKLLAKNEGLKKVFEKPFKKPLEPLTENKFLKYYFPSKDETFGSVIIAWRLESNLIDSIFERYALNILSEYWTKNSNSLLNKNFVEIEDPFATSVSFSIQTFSHPLILLLFSGVPTQKIEEIEPHFNKVLSQYLSQGDKVFDTIQIHRLISKDVTLHEINIKDNPSEIVFSSSKTDLIYGEKDSPEDLQKFLNIHSKAFISQFLNSSSAFWASLSKTLLKRHKIVMLNIPSRDKNDALIEEEKNRVKQQIKDLGPEGLEKAQNKVDKAVNASREPPTLLLKSVPFANVSKIPYRHLQYYNHSTGSPEGYDISRIPFKIQMDDIETDVVRIFLLFDIQNLSVLTDKYYVVLLLDLWLSSPLMKNETLIPLHDLENERAEKTLRFSKSLRFGSLSEVAVFIVYSTMSNYDLCIQLMKDTLFHVHLSENRTRTVVKKLLNQHSNAILETNNILSSLMNNILYNNRTFAYYKSLFRYKKFLETVLLDLESRPKEILEKMMSLKNKMIDPSSSLLYLSTDLSKLKNAIKNSSPLDHWINFFPLSKTFPKREELSQPFYSPPPYLFLSSSPSFRHVLYSHSQTRSCYLEQNIFFPSLDNESQELTNVRVLLKYITDKMYGRIRGLGLAYSAHVSGHFSSRLLKLSLERSSQLGSAYEEFRNVLHEIVQGLGIEDILLDSVKGSLIYSFVESEETPTALASSSISSYLRQLRDPFYNRRVIQQIVAVTLKDVVRAAQVYVKDFLDPQKTLTAVVCHPNAETDLIQTFKTYGIEFKTITDLDNSILTD